MQIQGDETVHAIYAKNAFHLIFIIIIIIILNINPSKRNVLIWTFYKL